MSREARGYVRYKTLLYVFVALLVFGAGVFAGWFGRKVPETSRAVRESGYEFINPILLCNLDSSLVQNENSHLTQALRAYIEQSKNRDVGVYYLNPSVAQWAGYNENKSFSPASMLKVPIMAAVLRSAEEHPELMQKKIYYDGAQNHNALQSIQPQHPLVAGRSYGVSELLRSMIVESDNNATDLLTNLISKKEFENVFTDLGLSVPSAGGPTDFMSPKTFTLFLRILYNGTYLTREHSEQALSLMSQSEFKPGIKAGVPADVTVAEKFGERQFVNPEGKLVVELHDCGVVYAGNQQYFLCIMTRGNDFTVLANEIAEISKLVFEHH